MSDDLVIGAIFAGRYRVERRIATGGMGSVYEVVHVETSRRRALKVMHPDLVQNDESRDRFRQEARVTAQIESEYIVDVFDAGIDDPTGMPYLVMELLQGEEISKRIKRLERLSAQDTVLYLYQAALGLDKTHRSRIVHRDLKPDNLYLCEREDGPPRIKILDFGIAKIVAANVASAKATQAVGTPLYMAPEQFLVDSAVSPATDLYALAMIAYTMLVGQTYWFEESKKGANVFAFAAYATLGPQEAASARALRNGVTLPPAFDAWFVKATSRKPTDRFATGTAMVVALAEALGTPPPAAILASAYVQGTGQPVVIPNDADRTSLVPGSSTASLLSSSHTRKDPFQPRRPMLAAGAIVMAACVVLGLLYVVFSSSGSTDATNPDPASGEPATSAHQLPRVVPVASAAPPMDTAAPPPAVSSPASAAPSTSASTPKNPSGPSTTTTKKKWVRD